MATWNHDSVMSPESAAVSGIKPVYLVILLSHIFLAVCRFAIGSAFVLLRTHRPAQKHRRITRFSYPIWFT